MAKAPIFQETAKPVIGRGAPGSVPIGGERENVTERDAFFDQVTNLPIVSIFRDAYEERDDPNSNIDVLLGLRPYGTPDPNFRPQDHLAGYSQYARDILGTTNMAEMERLKRRIDENERIRKVAAQELSMVQMLGTELFNPINLVPIPFLAAARGLGVIRGGLRGAAGVGTVMAAEESLRQWTDPTATLGESVMNVAFGSLMGGAMGGALGAIGARANADLARIGRLENARREGLISDADFMDALPMAAREEVGLSPAFRVEETTAAQGVAKALGFEKQTLMTVWGQLKARGIQSVQDFSDIMLGDFNVMNASNFDGKATAQSIKLNVDTAWKARGMGVTEDLHAIYGKMVRGGDEASAKPLGIDPTTAKSATKEFFSKAPRGDGHPRFDEFKRKVFEAYLKGDSKDPYVLEGVQKLQEFFNFARERMEGSGTLPTARTYTARIEKKVTEAREARAAIDRANSPEERMALETKLSHAVRDIGREIDRGMEERGFSWLVSDAKDNLRERNMYTSDAVSNRVMLDQEMVTLLEREDRVRGLSPDEVDMLNDLRAGLAGVQSPSNPMAARGYSVPEEYFPLEPEKISDNPLKLLDHIATSSKSPAHRSLARRLAKALDGMEIEMVIGRTRREWSMKAPREQQTSHAYARWDADRKRFQIGLNGSDGKLGFSEVAILHEMIHILTGTRLGLLRDPQLLGLPADQRALVQEAISDLNIAWQAVRDVVDEDTFKRYSGDNFPLGNLDEFVTWGLTDPEFRRMLDQIMPDGPDATRTRAVEEAVELTAWQRFWNGVRKLIGLEPKYDDVIKIIVEERASLLSHADEMFDYVIDTIAAARKNTGADERLGRRRMIEEMDEANRLIEEARQKELEDMYGMGMATKADDLNARQDYLQVLEQRAKDYMPDFANKKMGGEPYLPRFWLIDRIMDDEAGDQVLRGILREHYRRTGGGTPEQIELRVKESIETITQQSELGEMQLFPPDRGSMATFMKRRKIDIPTSKVMDFIETDPDKILRSYAERAGTIDEINRIFGDVDAQGAIDDIMVQAAREGVRGEEFIELRKQLELARDKRTDAVYGMEPNQVNQRRIASAVRSYGVVTYLGKAALSAIPEIGRTLMVHGFARTFEAVAAQAFKNPAFAKSWKLLPRKTGKGLDSLAGTSMNRFVEQGGPTGAATTGLGRGAQRFVDFASGPAFLMNLLSPMTDMTKRMSQTFTHQFMLEDVLALANGKATKKTQARLASYGIDEDMAERIANQPFENADGWYMPNMDEWPDAEAARAFLTAVSGMTDNIVPTAGLADVPEIAKGFYKGREYPLLVLPFQFMSYGFSVANRVMLSGLQGRDASAMMGVAALIGLGYLSQKIKSDENYWNSMGPLERSIRAVDAAGITGIYSDLNTTLEQLSGDTLGVRPLLGADPFLGNQTGMEKIGGLGGPTGDTIVDIANLMTDDSMTNAEAARTARGLMPTNTIFYMDGLWDQLQAWGAGSPQSESDDMARQVGEAR